MSSGVTASGCLDIGTSQDFQSAIPQNMNSLSINGFSNLNPGIHKTVRGPYAGKVSSACESSKFVDAMMFASIPRSHPNSLPEYHDSLANGSPYKSSSTIGNVSGTIGPGVTEGSHGRHMPRLDSTGKLTDLNGGGKSTGYFIFMFWGCFFYKLNFCNCLLVP